MLRRLVASILILVGATAPAAWVPTVIETFPKPAAQSVAPLVLHADGAFYGTASSGGAHDLGAILRLVGGSVEIVHAFDGADGSGPAAGLVAAPDGSLYGTTSAGGSGGFGTAFRFNPTTAQLTTLVHFNGTDGSVPGALRLHADGFLYGLTRAGGTHGHGTVFRLATDGTLTTLHHFAGTDGSEPRGPLVAVGNDLYGLCRFGGTAGLGSAFRITTAGGFNSLFSFSGGAGSRPGANPAAGLVLHSSGTLFGTTEYGGSSGFGTAFSLTTAAVPVFASLHDFADPTGSQPAGTLVEGNDGRLYGTCATGGASGIGNLYRLTTSGTHTPLHDFSGEDGASPLAGLSPDASGLLHGITSAGGPGEFGRAFTLSTAGVFTAGAALSPASGFLPSGAPVSDGIGGWIFPTARGGENGAGTVIHYDPSAGVLTPTPLGNGLGDTPDGALVAHGGSFAGVCARGGALGRGTAFTYSGGVVTALTDFDTAGGSLAEGPLLSGPGGFLFGLAREGGSTARGAFFRIASGGTRTRILSFTGLAGTAPGREPRGGIVLTAAFNTYGATALGGASNAGTLFKVDPLGNHSLVAEFSTGGVREPDGGLVPGADGFIYGTCRSGGVLDGGAIVRIDPATDTWSVVASFDPAAASAPAGELLAAPDGSLYGLSAADDGAIFRYQSGTGLEILSTLDATTTGLTRTSDESGLSHTGGLALDADGSLLATVAGAGPDGGGLLLRLSPPTPLSIWKEAELGDPAAPDLGDPDGDGLVTLVEYALDSDPASPTPPLATALVSGRLEITVPRQPDHDDITVIVEASPDLSSPWEVLATSTTGAPFSGPGYVSGDSATPGLKTVLIRDTLALPDAPRRFLRLRVER